MFRRLSLLLLAAMLVVSSFAVSGCAAQGHDDVAVTLASMDQMPAHVQNASHRVAQAYRFAVAHPDLLQHMPCYCGCGPMGHDSNYNCFWQTEELFDSHALGCGICVDACPEGVLELVNDIASPVNDETCTACATCMEECPMGAIEEIEED